MNLKPSPKLKILSAIYEGITTLRNSLYDRGTLHSYQSPIPVISVGNIVAGGSGKSPFCDYLALNLIKSYARRPAILGRGYGGKSTKTVLVNASSTAKEVGDEAVMHFANLTPTSGSPTGSTNHTVNIITSADRVAGIKFIEKEQLADIVILDDGFQHRRLKRNADIVLSDISEGVKDWEDAKILPAGYFRENRNKALQRADFVIFINKCSTGTETQFISTVQEQKEKLSDYIAPERIFAMQVQPAYFRDIVSGETFPTHKFNNSAAICMTAIANPISFSEILKNLGVRLRSERYFKDHYLFKSEDLDSAMQIPGNLPILVTSKDAVKLRRLTQKPHTIYELIISMEFISENQKISFWEQVAGKTIGCRTVEV